MFYYMYEIKNNVNGKIYIGVHKTPDMNDGYMGSGKHLKRSQEKHGIDKFEKKILEFFVDAESMYNKERSVVNEIFIARPDVYNINLGGNGGFESINSSGKNLYGHNGKSGYGLENLIYNNSGISLVDLLIERGTYDLWKHKISKPICYNIKTVKLVHSLV
jgi:hypothetical protein